MILVRAIVTVILITNLRDTTAPDTRFLQNRPRSRGVPVFAAHITPPYFGTSKQALKKYERNVAFSKHVLINRKKLQFSKHILFVTKKSSKQRHFIRASQWKDPLNYIFHVSFIFRNKFLAFEQIHFVKLSVLFVLKVRDEVDFNDFCEAFVQARWFIIFYVRVNNHFADFRVTRIG